MKIRIENPPGFNAESMMRKYIWAIYQMSPADFVAMVERDAKQEHPHTTSREEPAPC